MSSPAVEKHKWVNERVRQALAAASHTELLKALVEAFPGSWFFTRVDLTFAFVNQNACDSLGYTRDELMALTLYDVNPTLTPELWNGLLAMGPFTPASVRTVHRRKDGTTFPVEAFGSRIILGDENVSVSYVVDLSEEAQARQALAENQHLLKSVLDNAPVIVWSVDPDRRFQLAEGSGLSLLGLEPGQIVGRTVAQQFPQVLQIIEATERALRGEAIEDIVTVAEHAFEYRYVPRRDDRGAVIGATGVAIDVTARHRAEQTNQRLTTAIEQADEAVLLLDPQGRIEYANAAFAHISGVPRAQATGQTWPTLPSSLGDDGADGQLRQALAVGTAWSGTLRCRRPDQRDCIHQTSLSPLRGNAGSVTGFVAVIRDVTDRVRTEERLRQVEKMDAVGQLAGGVAHDFNNLLQVILGNADLCLALEPAEPQRGRLSEIREAGKRAAALVHQLLTFSRNVGEPKPIDLAALVARMLPLLRRLLGEHIIIVVDYADRGLVVRGDESGIEQVLVNLCVNARDAMPGGGRLELRLSRRTVDLVEAERRGLAGSGNYIVVEVTDDGCGMSEEVQRRAFEPFFTTKEPGIGTGLGLATVYGVAQRHGGAVEVQSRIHSGSRFRVLLRACEQEVEPPAPRPRRMASQGHLRVLLAEDDASVREVVHRFLVQAHHEVTVARNGAEAVARFQAEAARFDLLVLDAIMPSGNGPEVYRAFRRVSPVPVLFVTGHDFDVLASLPQDSSWGLLRKPFGPDELDAAIERLVGG